MDNNVTTWNRIKDSDIYYNFIKSPTAIISSVILLIIFFCSFFVELITPYNPFDPASLSLMDAFTPPAWTEEGLSKFILGTDGQGRDLLSTILYGSRISLIVGFSAIIFSLILGVGLGFGSTILGKKAAMLCTASVEEVIDKHYQSQINQLGPEEKDLKKKIIKFRDDELHHKDIAYEKGATKKGLYSIMDKIIKTGSKLAINISEKI